MSLQSTAWISRARLNLAHTELAILAEMALGDPYHEHQLIWRFFGADPDARRRQEDDEQPLFLYRREGDGRHAAFYLVSRQPPQAESLLWQVDSKAYQPNLAAGDRIAFQLRANPTVARKQALEAEELARYNTERQQRGLAPKEGHSRRRFDDVLLAAKKQGRSQGLTGTALRAAMYEAACSWLTRQGDRLGMAFDEIEIMGDEYREFQSARDGRRITFSAVDYQGIATITDPERAASALTNGIGRAKAFGMGLMLVRRL